MAKKDYAPLARIIIQYVGGKENVIDVHHCVTRLRFRLKDEDKANTEMLSQADGVVTVMRANGQYQVVIGPAVTDVYDEVVRLGHFEVGGLVDDEGNPIADDVPAEKKGLMAIVIDLVTGIIQPTLGCLAAAGMVKGLLALFTTLGWVSTDGGTYTMLYTIGDAFFYFLPVALAYTSAKKFRSNIFIALTIGFALCYPSMTALLSSDPIGTFFVGTPLQLDYYTDFLGVPVIMSKAGYTSSIIPIIAAVWAESRIEHRLDEVLPVTVKMFMTPFLSLLVSIPLTYLVIGPIASLLTSLISGLFTTIYDIPVVGGVIAAAFLAGIWPVLIVFGLHWAIVPIMLVNLGTLGYDQTCAAAYIPIYAQTIALLAVYLKTSDPMLKEMCIPSFISGIFGTIEPGLYGVLLPKKSPFVAAVIGSVCGGAWAGLTGLKYFMSGYNGLLGLTLFVDPSGTEGVTNMVNLLIAAVISMVVTFAIIMLTYRDGQPAKQAA